VDKAHHSLDEIAARIALPVQRAGRFVALFLWTDWVRFVEV